MTPGALRAGQRIHAVLKRHLPLLNDSTAGTIAQIVDGETAAPELLALAKHILALETDPYLQGHPEWEAFLNEAKAAETKAEVGQV